MHPDGDFFSCGIRLSMSLHANGAFNKIGYKKAGNKVSSHGWAMVAEQLYQWLRLHELGDAQIFPVTGSDRASFPAQNGVIYLRNSFVRTSDSTVAGRTGDHIDLYVVDRGLLSALRWPVEFPGGPFELVGTCRDGRVRFWPLK
jgi:hypothetical protein